MSVRMRHGAGGVHKRDTHSPFEFDPSEPGLTGDSGVKGTPWSEARDGEQQQMPDIAPGAVDGTVHIAPGTLGLDLFASSIVPPRVVDSLPDLPDTDYPEGSLVFLTTDKKLYRNRGYDSEAADVMVDGDMEAVGSWSVGDFTLPYEPDNEAGEFAYEGTHTARLVAAGSAIGASTPFIVVDRTKNYAISAKYFVRSWTAGQPRLTVSEYSSADVLLQMTDLDGGTGVTTDWETLVGRFGPEYVAWHADTAKIIIRIVAFGSPTLTLDFDDVKIIPDIGEWSAEVDGEDIVANSITAGQIAAGAIGTDQLAADAVIANVINAGGTVVINSDGITITDEFGNTSLTSAGFAGTWITTLFDGLYNSRFEYGTNGAMTFDQNPSSDEVPYWKFDYRTEATATATRVTDANAPGGFAIRVQPGGGASGVYASVAQWRKISVVGGRRVIVRALWRGEDIDAGHPVRIRANLYWYDREGSLISGNALDSIEIDTDDAAGVYRWSIVGVKEAPQHAASAYLRIGPYFSTGVNSSSSFVDIAEVQVLQANDDMEQIIIGGTTLDDGNNNGSLRVSGEGETVVYIETGGASDDGGFKFYQSGEGYPRVEMVVDSDIPQINMGDGTTAVDATLSRLEAGVMGIGGLAIPTIVGTYTSDSAGNQAGITSYTDITGATLTFTAVAGRRYYIYAEVFLLTSVATDRIGLEIHDGSGQLQSDRDVPGTTTATKFICSTFYDPSAGSQTIVLKAGRSTGTGSVTVVQGPTNPTTFYIMDVGPTP